MAREPGWYWCWHKHQDLLLHEPCATFWNGVSWNVNTVSRPDDFFKKILPERIPYPEKQREEGFYWVEYRGKWTIAEWENHKSCETGWRLTESLSYLSDAFLTSIGEKIPSNNQLIRYYRPRPPVPDDYWLERRSDYNEKS